jgi:hypothetical protein|tara:strand:- start:2290 stop:2559 length:270 start_codon:yes stop_codon:yes gene_type:complete
MLSRRSLIGLLAIGCISAMVYGLIIVEDAPTAGNSYIGFGTLFLFLIAMPLFIFTEGKGKKVKDYMLTEENIRKMQAKSKKRPKKEDKV